MFISLLFDAYYFEFMEKTTWLPPQQYRSVDSNWLDLFPWQ